MKDWTAPVELAVGNLNYNFKITRKDESNIQMVDNF